VTADEWTRVRDLFEAALKQRPSQRAAFLDEACADSPAVRAEVTSLLDAHDSAADFIEAPAYEVAADLLADDPPESLAGRALGPYLIRHEIGRGGMGVVYLADDTRLSRRVALKAIAPGGGSDARRRARMRLEARAAAGLSHPGIATVYALEEIDDQLYLACEYVPGSTLRALLKGGPLSLPQVVDIAAQLARALAAAHAHGVVHRDLKPENVVRSDTGVVKILDFGIARVEHLSDARLTLTGTLVGTPAYMSPEQVRGHHVDFRADLFAWGVIVYEMTSGSNPFEAETASATIARILESEPPPLSAPPSTGLQSPSGLPIAGAPWGRPIAEALDRIVAICLRKRAEDRYGSTQELVADLERLQGDLLVLRDQGPPSRLAAAAPAPSGRMGPLGPSDRMGPMPVDARHATAQWWWQFHQVAVSTLYAGLIYPAWRARVWMEAPWGMLFFFALLAAAATSITVRLHLRFTARVYPTELPLQRARALPWTRWSDGGFSVTLLLAGLGLGATHPEVATLFVAVSIAGAVATFIIEPATTRAAFGDESPRKTTTGSGSAGL
jgi:serine/threonine protein kinase